MAGELPNALYKQRDPKISEHDLRIPSDRAHWSPMTAHAITRQDHLLDRPAPDTLLRPGLRARLLASLPIFRRLCQDR